MAAGAPPAAHSTRTDDAYSHHRRGRHDRPQDHRAAAGGRPHRQARDHQAHAARHRGAGRAADRRHHDPADRRRHLRPHAGRPAGRRKARHRHPSGGDRLGRGGGGFRQGLCRQFRRHAASSSTRSGLQNYRPRVDLRLVDRGLRRAVPRADPGRFPPDAADQLRHAEGGRRAPPERLFAARLLRRHRPPASDHLRAARASRTRRRPASSPTSSASR